MTCPTCGRPMPEGRLRCPTCGTMHNFTVPAPVRAARGAGLIPRGAGLIPREAGLIPGEPVRSVQAIAWSAIVLVCAETIMGVVVLGVLAFADVRVSDRVLIAIVVITAVFTIASFVVTIIWLWRCRKNLEAFENTDPRWRPGWSIGAWFIPLASLVLVPMVIADVARNSARNETDANRAVVAAWVWGVGQLITTCADRLTGAGLNVAGFGGPGLSPGAAFTMSATTVMVSLALLLTVAGAQIVFVKSITDQQQARLAPAPGARVW